MKELFTKSINFCKKKNKEMGKGLAKSGEMKLNPTLTHQARTKIELAMGNKLVSYTLL